MKLFSLSRPLVLAILVVLTLTGCATRYVDRVVTKTEYVVVAPEAQYLVTTPVPAPPARAVFAPGEYPDFEKLFMEQAATNRALYKAVGMCNADKAAARADITKKKKSYD